MKRFILALGLIFAPLLATPAFGQAVTATLPVTCPASGVNCVRAQPVTNPDGTSIGGGGTYTGPLASQLPATLGAKTGASSLSVVPNTDTAFPVTAASLPLPTGAATSAKQDTMIANQTATGTLAQNVQGNVAAGAADAGSPVKVGGYASTSAPGAVTAGQRVNAWYSTNGAGAAFLVDSAGAAVNSSSISTDGNNAPTNALTTKGYNLSYNGTNWDRARTIAGSDGTGLGITAVAIAPQSNASGGVVPGATSAVASNVVAKASAGNVYRAAITTGATPGYFMGFNATTAPADGAVTPIMCRVIAANSTLSISFADMPSYWGTGITFVFSSTGCFTKTASATAYIEYSVK